MKEILESKVEFRKTRCENEEEEEGERAQLLVGHLPSQNGHVSTRNLRMRRATTLFTDLKVFQWILCRTSLEWEELCTGSQIYVTFWLSFEPASYPPFSTSSRHRFWFLRNIQSPDPKSPPPGPETQPEILHFPFSDVISLQASPLPQRGNEERIEVTPEYALHFETSQL